MSISRQHPLALIADDEADIRELMAQSLQASGFDVVEAGETKDAVSAFAENRPDLVLLDVRMPSPDGLEACRRIREMPDGQTIPIMIVTAYEDDDTIDRAYEAGATDFITKPINWRLLRHRIRYLIRASEAEREAAQVHDYLMNTVNYFPGAFTIYDSDDRLIVTNKAFRRDFPNIPEGTHLKDAVATVADTGIVDFGGLGREEWLAEQFRLIEKGTWWDHRFTDGRWIRQYARRLNDGSTFIMAFDVTEVKEHEQVLRQAKEEAEAANRIKAQFLAGMSHELRTPLNAIIGFSDVIRKQTMGKIDNPAYVEYAEDINKSGMHLLDTLTLILDISKVEAGREVLHDNMLDVGELLRRVERKFAERAAEKDIRLAVEPVSLPFVLGDETRLARVLFCLLDNAIKFTPSGGRVELSAGESQDGVHLQIRDNGIGMETEDIPRALSLFSQLDETHAREFSGMGLGLAYAKTLVEAHGACLTLESTPKAGTTVTITLPPERVCTDTAPDAENPAESLHSS